MRKGTLLLVFILLLSTTLGLSACVRSSPKIKEKPISDTRPIIDGEGRTVDVPYQVKRVVCVGVGALRYTSYLGAVDRVVGVEDYEKKREISRLYNYLNYDKFEKLPVIGVKDEPDPEAIMSANPEVILASSFFPHDYDALQEKTGIPVVVLPMSDTALDRMSYETIRILGELYGAEERAKELKRYLDLIEQDLDRRTADIPEVEKPSIYVGAISFKGHHGFEGTEAKYVPLSVIYAKNMADTTGQKGAFNIDLEKVLEWDPDIIFLDFNGLNLVKEQYAKNPEYFKSLSAVKNSKVYSQISFRSAATNLETALADAYYAGSIIYPERFKDIDIDEKADEIFEKLLGVKAYDLLKEAGYEFKQIDITN